MTFPESVSDLLSPQAITIDTIVAPVGAAALIPNVLGVPAVGLVGGVMSTVGLAKGDTVMDADAVDVSPKASNPVTTTRNDPGEA